MSVFRPRTAASISPTMSTTRNSGAEAAAVSPRCQQSFCLPTKANRTFNKHQVQPMRRRRENLRFQVLRVLSGHTESRELLRFSFPTDWVALLACQQCFPCDVLAAVNSDQGSQATLEYALQTS